MWGPKFALAEGMEPEKVMRLVGMFVQIVGALRVLQPVFAGVQTLFAKMLLEETPKCILHSMTINLSGNSKLRGVGYEAADMLIKLVQQQAGGYMFWQSLPTRGAHNKKALRKKIADNLLDIFFSQPFLQILLTTALTPEGKPVQPLYNWLVETVYANNTQNLYADWCKVKKV